MTVMLVVTADGNVDSFIDSHVDTGVLGAVRGHWGWHLPVGWILHQPWPPEALSCPTLKCPRVHPGQYILSDHNSHHLAHPLHIPNWPVTWSSSFIIQCQPLKGLQIQLQMCPGKLFGYLWWTDNAADRDDLFSSWYFLGNLVFEILYKSSLICSVCVVITSRHPPDN